MDDVLDDLIRIADRCERAARVFDTEPLLGIRKRLCDASDSIAEAWSGGWIGYHAHVYTADLSPRRPGQHFDLEWGATYGRSMTTDGVWAEFRYDAVYREILCRADGADPRAIEDEARRIGAIFDDCKRELLPTLDAVIATHRDETLMDIRKKAAELSVPTSAADYLAVMRPSQVMTRDQRAIQSGMQVPHHLAFDAYLLQELSYGSQSQKLAELARHAATYLQKRRKMKGRTVTRTEGPIFIGHGRSAAWKELKDFVVERLRLDYEEFNRESTAGRSTKERLLEMLDRCCFALLVMTAEDEQADGDMHARQNVIHEVGLFQGRYGFERAIVLLEDGCREFSNIHGVGQIRFPKGNIAAAWEDVRRVLERERIL